MMTLVRLLPLLIGNFVNEDDDHWECFCILWAISDMVCTFEVHPDDPACLAWLVQVYLESFTRIYPDVSVTPCPSSSTDGFVSTHVYSVFKYV